MLLSRPAARAKILRSLRVRCLHACEHQLRDHPFPATQVAVALMVSPHPWHLVVIMGLVVLVIPICYRSVGSLF